jgi:Asp-tRNA(Asn)/Glu-tRNA(Gln) amidotransferase A subunit family amidase
VIDAGAFCVLPQKYPHLFGVVCAGRGFAASERRPQLAAGRGGIRQLRIGVCRTNAWPEAQPEAIEALESAARSLAGAGAIVSETPLPPVFDGLEETFGVISTVEASRALTVEERDHRPKLNFWIGNSLDAAARHDQSVFDRAQQHAVECQKALAAMFQRCDVLIAPSTSGEAPADLVSVSSSAFNRTWTLMHVPCLTIPAYSGPNGMPVGVQVVGPVGRDAATIAAAQCIADVLMKNG